MATFTVPGRADDRVDVDPVHPGSHPTPPPTAPAAVDRPWLRRGSVGLLLAGAAALYLIGLSASGYANSFYAAAAQAGSQSWEAFFFGSLDAGNAITVDKPPFSLWLMALSIRIFGLSSWSLLVPQALLGVATVGVVYASVRRSAGHRAGLLAGAVLALTPVATLMFRFDNPDAMLVFLLALASYLVLRATERARVGSLTLAGVLVGLAFLTKMLQAFLVLPAFALVYLIAAPATLRRRILHLLAAFGAVIVAAGWWVAVVELVPASMRPYVGGSQGNSVLDLVFGYNGFSRILGGAGGNGAPGGGGASFGSEVGLTRMFAGVSGGMVAWLIPAAVVLGAAALVLRHRTPRTDRLRAAVILWLGSLVTTAAVFSFMAGTYHDYYTVALTPGIAGSVAVGGYVVWQQRDRLVARLALAVAMALTTVWGVVLLGQATGVYADLRWVVGVAGALATAGLVVANRLARPAAAAVAALAVAAGLTGPAAFSLDTAATAHRGSIVTAGPARDTGSTGGAGGMGTPGQGGRFQRDGQAGGTPPNGTPGQAQGQAQGQTQRPGGIGGGMEGGTAGSALVTMLETDADQYTWVAATVGSSTAATYQLASQSPVMAIGGFNGGDDAPTLAQFQSDVAAGKVHYFIAGGGMGGGRGGPGGGSSAGTQIAEWVAATYTATTVDGVTVYDLSPTS